MVAVTCNNPTAIKILWTRRDLQLDLANASGETALHVAVTAGSTAAARALLQYGATASLLNKQGYSALHLAILSAQVRGDVWSSLPG